jgi:Response regulator consisting of a CheY-like receiver domain and a Fis-type HTH domain
MPKMIGNSPILLIVDDDDLVLSGLQVFFSATGYETLASRTLSETLRVCQRFEITPAIAILNYHLNDGLSFDERIALFTAQFPDVPVTVLTGDTSQQTAAIVRNSGFRLLLKPVAPLDILNYVRGVVDFGTIEDQANRH